jgi:hypothetical protein
MELQEPAKGDLPYVTYRAAVRASRDERCGVSCDVGFLQPTRPGLGVLIRCVLSIDLSRKYQEVL